MMLQLPAPPLIYVAAAEAS